MRPIRTTMLALCVLGLLGGCRQPKPTASGQPSRRPVVAATIFPLASLVTDRPLELQTFGKNMLQSGLTSDSGINDYFSCLDGLCLKDGVVRRLNSDELLVPLTDENAGLATKTKIEALERHYYGAAMRYLFDYSAR